ncbi:MULTISPECIES: hypothetical protein [Corynebacterium]|uniref:hypothetical protein n=1 Tax=Corynebacterium TaxID=1716 RepID=UPI001651D7D2|nr:MULTISPECIES: hypothetical protein [Corynebacterium]MBC6831126.1 hypothetical protein [Corynebacterium sp. LK29]MCA0443921.1 hypothetical protein [Corynebacterium amycolatum]MCT1548261.1 hypothetical protein [Corynebacterium amycolatum]MEB2596929.1 hypothetical protein [Corynebacterium amycolatum]
MPQSIIKIKPGSGDIAIKLAEITIRNEAMGMKPIYEFEDQPINNSLISHILTWLIPLPTYLPITTGESFTFWTLGEAENGGSRTVIRFISAKTSSDDTYHIIELMKLASQLYKSASESDAETNLDSLLVEKSQLQTFAEISVFTNLNCADDEVEGRIHEAFDSGLKLIRQLQRSINMIDQIPRPLVTTQSLPSVVPYWIKPINETITDEQISLYLIPTVLTANSHWHHLESSDDNEPANLIASNLIYKALDRQMDKGPFTAYSDLINEAKVSILNAGLSRAALLTAASAGEALLDEVLCSLLWELGKSPEEVGKLYCNKRDFKPRVVSLLQNHLKGNWKLKGNEVIARWFEEVYQLRHSVIHAGTYPETALVYAAISLTLELNQFVADRIASQYKIFPRTAIFYLGVPSLQKRGIWTPEFAHLVTDPTEPNWTKTFTRWRESMEQMRNLYRFRQTLSGDIQDSQVRFWVHTSGAFKWVLFDPNSNVAAEIDPCKITGISDTDLDETKTYIALAEAGLLNESLYRTFSSASVRIDSELDWKLPYHLLPDQNVLVNGNDLNLNP